MAEVNAFDKGYAEGRKDEKRETESKLKKARLSALQECREIADDKELAEQIMKAFYRREHHAEPDEKDVAYLTARMMTALCLMSSKFQSLIDKEGSKEK